MKTQINLDIGIDETLEKVNKLIEELEIVKDKSSFINFIKIKELVELTGWSEKTVQNLFNEPDFPSCDYGKEKIVEIHALREYFKVPRRKCF